MLWRRRPLDRNQLVAAADRSRSRGRVRKAIAGYRKALALSPGDAAIHGKLAPLLARIGQREESLRSFRTAADAHIKAGFADRGVSLLAQAAGAFPEEYGLWEEIVRLHIGRGRRPDAVAALLSGARRLHRSRDLAVATRVLQRALEIEAWHPEATTLLARTLARSGRKGEALALLDGLEPRTSGPLRRRVRWLAVRVSPSPRRLWRALRSGAAGR